jgi:hypothetical protein
MIKILKLQNNNIIGVYLPACASHGWRVCENLPVETKGKSRYRGPACPVKSRRAIYLG